MVYTLTLNPALDYVITLDGVKSEGINRVKKEKLYCGGKGINVSRVLTSLGVENTALGFIAGFTGDELERRLKEDGIDCSFIRLKNGRTRINVKMITPERYDINAAGPDVSEKEVEKLLKKLNDLRKGDFLVLSGSVPSTIPLDFYERILAQLEGKGVYVIVDAEGGLLLKTLKYRPFLIKPNHQELGDLFDIEAEDEAEVEKYAKELQRFGAENVLVSRAENGALLADSTNTITKAKNAKGKLINSTGCGDAMVAGFIAGFIKTGNYDYALKLGTACGCATAFSDDLATKPEIEKVLKAL